MEAIVALFVLGFLVTIAFLTFSTGNNMFHQAVQRQSIQSELTRFKSLLQGDVALCGFRTLSAVSRELTVNVGGVSASTQRDGLALATLDDWYAPGNFEPATGLPLYNRYIVYYASYGTFGKLVRQEVLPPSLPPQGLLFPYTALDSNPDDRSDFNDDVVKTTFLSDNVYSFTAEPVLENGTLQVNLWWRRPGGHQGASISQADESLQVDLLFRPRNTWPEF